MFIVFGLSLLGAFELTLPSGLLTKLNQASEGGGYFGTLIMGLTFTLTSFACIGPIVGSAAGRFRANRRYPAGARHGVFRHRAGRCRFSFWRCFPPS